MCQVVQVDCDKKAAKDKTLPKNSYLVTYLIDTKLTHDIVICRKRSDVFDMYWDKYRKELKSIEWTDGNVDPRNWEYRPPEKKKK